MKKEGKLKVNEIVGILNHTKEEFEDLKKRVAEVRNSTGMEERIEDVRTRLKHNN